MAKKRIAVLFGGMSSEHEVSRVSAASVIENLPKDRYEVCCIGITKKGRWLYYPGDYSLIATGQWEQDPDCVPAMLSPDRVLGGVVKLMSDFSVSYLRIDAVFPVLHGKNGEDGTMQGLLALSGLPYVGCDTLSSAVCMDKGMTHLVLENAGIRMASYVEVRNTAISQELLEQIVAKLGLPLFVKPAAAGSSVGVSKVFDRKGLKKAVQLAFSHDKKVLVEQYIQGREIECAVLGNAELVASRVGEIVPAEEFYSYEAKYISGDSKLFIPADVPEETENEIRRIAAKAFTALGCFGMARVDFFLQEDGDIILNEVNTIPGFTSISMYPKLLEASGIPYPELLHRLIELAIERENQR